MLSEIYAEIRSIFKPESRRLRLNERDHDRVGFVFVKKADLFIDRLPLINFEPNDKTESEGIIDPKASRIQKQRLFEPAERGHCQNKSQAIDQPKVLDAGPAGNCDAGERDLFKIPKEELQKEQCKRQSVETVEKRWPASPDNRKKNK